MKTGTLGLHKWIKLAASRFLGMFCSAQVERPLWAVIIPNHVLARWWEEAGTDSPQGVTFGQGIKVVS